MHDLRWDGDAPAVPNGDAARVAELAQQLRRPQKTMPAWVFSDADERDRLIGLLRGAAVDAERALVTSHLPEIVTRWAPTAIVHLRPGASDAARTSLARLPDSVGVLAVRVPAPTLDLPPWLARPRLYLWLGNALGANATVSAVRALRAVRVTMAATDQLVLGVDLRRHAAAGEAGRRDAVAALAAALAPSHRRALDAVGRALGATFDTAQFDVRVAYDAESARVETHLVARRALRVATVRAGMLAFRKGESIRTGVDCRYEREGLAALLAGAGLTLTAWHAVDDVWGLALVAPVSASATGT